MNRLMLLPALALLLTGAGCNQLRLSNGPSAPAAPAVDFSLIRNFEIKCSKSGGLLYESWGVSFPQPLPSFMEYRGSGTGLSGRVQTLGSLPDVASGRFWGGSMKCTALPPEGEFSLYLIFPNGMAARYWRSFTMQEGSDGRPTLTTGELQRASVPVEELLAEQITLDGRWSLRLKETPTMPLDGLRMYCIQPTAPASFFRDYGVLNASERFPFVTPVEPPGLYVVIGAGNFAFESLNYVNGRYIAHGGSDRAIHSPVMLGLNPADGPFHFVVYYRWTDKRFPEKKGRFGRVYTRQPVTLRLEEGRLVCENTGEDNLVVEDMPENFSFPGYDYERDEFGSTIPLILPPELNPHASR